MEHTALAAVNFNDFTTSWAGENNTGILFIFKKNLPFFLHAHLPKPS
ncbi:hypothetical protein PROPEN_02678 [Proteus penneri ATCC 35198]|nr:hypothetical protein PROPEN_02678 [Proteus penneri ATCC 35198]